MGWDYQAKLEQHESQTDQTKGFGGKFGVQKDRQDKVPTHHQIIYTLSHATLHVVSCWLGLPNTTGKAWFSDRCQ